MTTEAQISDGGFAAPPSLGLKERLASPSLNGVVLVVSLMVAVQIGLRPIQDNSFLTHLATGRLILDTGSVPGTDPYSWTALGSDWTVQSWLASVVYAATEDVGGLNAIRVLAALVVVGLTMLLWKLTEPAKGLVARGLTMGLALAIGSDQWVERPLMFGALGLAVVLFAAEGRLDPRWLVPVMWIWANAHGSFPFGVVLLVLLALGRYLDERQSPSVELRCLVWTLVGSLLAAVGPLGVKVLTFPLQLLENREAFEHVREWQPIDMANASSQLFALQIAIALVALARVRRWRAVLPAVVFAVAAVGSARNILPASIVLTPVLAAGLAGVGRVEGTHRPRVARPMFHSLLIVTIVLAVVQLYQPPSALAPYPQEALRWMRQEQLLDTGTRVVSRDVVGNYMEFAYGPEQVRVFIDDRVDMFPVEVLDHYLDLTRDEADFEAVLSDVEPTAVLWDRASRFGQWLVLSDDWEVVWDDETWLVAVPSASAAPA